MDSRTNPSGRPTRIPFDIKSAQKPVFHALLEARDIFGGDTAALVDGDGRVLSYDEIIRAAFVLGDALKKGVRPGENDGVMLPTGMGAAIAFFALSAYGLVPTMLNFTSGEAGLKSALKTAKVKRIVTAHRFIELGKFEELEAALSKLCDLVYLEDVRAK